MFQNKGLVSPCQDRAQLRQLGQVILPSDEKTPRCRANALAVSLRGVKPIWWRAHKSHSTMASAGNRSDTLKAF
jgi:hypothetical protein